MIDLKANPFYLDDEDIAWVASTLASLTEEEKIGQIFCLLQREDGDWQGEADYILKYQPGGKSISSAGCPQNKEIHQCL